MSWYSISLALALRHDDATDISDANAIAHAFTDDTPCVHAMSRSGVLLSIVNSINEQFSPGSDLYLIQQFAKLEGRELTRALYHVEALIDRIDKNPYGVVEATKIPYTPHTVIYSKEFEPLPVQMVYPSDAVIKNGYALLYTTDQVRQLLSNATASKDPCPTNDDDGQSLEYVFNFLKSHHHLLEVAVKSDLVVVHGELG